MAGPPEEVVVFGTPQLEFQTDTHLAPDEEVVDMGVEDFRSNVGVTFEPLQDGTEVRRVVYIEVIPLDGVSSLGTVDHPIEARVIWRESAASIIRDKSAVT